MADPKLNIEHRTPNTEFSLNLFGAFEARVEGQPLPPLRSVKGKYLLALLALRAGKEVSRQWLAENLWPDSETPSDSLRQSLSDLRQKMGEQAVRLEAATKTTLRLNCENVEIDVAAFDKAIKRGDVEGLRQAVDLYRGDLLEGVSEAWILAERETRRQAYLNALEMLSAHARLDGDMKAEIAYLRRILASDCCLETAARNLMTVLVKAGEPQAALEAYRQLRQRLLTEGNAVPEAETQALYQRILKQNSGAGKSGKIGRQAALNEGSKGNAASLPVPEWAVVSPLSASGGNVPLALTPLIGRDTLLRDIETRLLTKPLVTLVGTGGVGKTRLATQAARDVIDSFADGAWFVDLSPFTAAAQVAQEIARVFGIRTEDGNDAAQTVATALHLRHLLIVLDNCETCLQAAASVAQELLRACPHLRLLATSRQRLGLSGEIVVSIPPLEIPTDEDIQKDIQRDGKGRGNLLDAPSIRLFVERAQSTRHDFAVTTENTPSLVEICRCLDGLPLAIELAAPLIELLTPQQIVTHLNQRFALLTDTTATRPPRHQSLRAAIASSVDLLPEPERILLRRLSVFVGGWTLDGAQAINDERGRMKVEGKTEDTRHKTQETQSKIQNLKSKMDSSFLLQPSSFALLRGLVAKSLVVAEEWNGQMRYRMLESLREFAGEMLAAAGEEAEMRTRHLGWMLQTALQAEPELTGARQAVWLERLEVETGNLRHALDWAEHDPHGRRSGLALANALGRYWQVRGYFAEGRERLARLLETSETRQPDAYRADAMNWLALLSVFTGDLDGAEAACRAGLSVWEEQGESGGAAGSLGILGIIAANRGAYDVAEKRYRQALEGARGAGDTLGEAGTLGYLGINAVNQGYYEEARTFYEASLQLRRSINDVWGIAASLNNLGQLARKNGELQRARELLSESLVLRRQLRDRRNVGITLNVLGLLAWEQGELQEASACLREATDLFEQLGDRRNIAYALEAWARLAAGTRHASHARQFYEAARQLREDMGSPMHPTEQKELERCLHAVLPLEANAADPFSPELERWTLEQALTEAKAFGLAVTANTTVLNSNFTPS